MTTENLVTARNKVDNVYELINDLVSNHSIDMLWRTQSTVESKTLALLQR